MTVSTDKIPSHLPRIALVSTHGYVAAEPPLGAADTGGQVVYVIELARKLALLGHEVDIYTRRFEDQPEFDEVDERVRVIRIPCGGKDFIPKEYLYRHLMEWCENAVRFIRRNNFTYTLINSHYWDAGIAGQRLSEALGVTHIHTPHSLGLWKKRQMETDYPDKADTFEKEFNFAERIKHELIIYRSCSMVIATTPIQVEVLVNDYNLPRDRVHMIPPGYDDNRFFPVSKATREMARQRFGFEGKVVMAMGRLATNKGYDLLIDGFSVLAEREPEARLHLAVGGENMDAHDAALLAELKERVAGLELEDKVVFSGFVTEEELPDFYRAADLFVLSSRYEPFGMTAIEAMASGTPTVITIHGGLFRAVSYGRHALFADPFDKYDLGITMMKPLKHERLYGRLSRMGAHKARSLFTWTGIAQQLIGVVEGRPMPQAMDDNEWAEPWTDGD
ncbi:glycosyltransferase family 1 protein [Pararhizobium sp. A13]|uniref:glycosyltransferase family 4 protein n=1 Tax=Pararhizobium sp. A13 TaxID=3133975 RepID=UPI0032472391